MFKVGDKIVYPSHGAGTIEKIEEKLFLGEKQVYYVLLLEDNLKVMVPAEESRGMGLRSVIGRKEAGDVFSVLGKRRGRMPSDWNKRFKQNKEKIKSGNIFEVAVVVRNLFIRERKTGLSTVEKRMLTQAKKILISELIYALGSKEESISQKVEEVVLNGGS